MKKIRLLFSSVGRRVELLQVFRAAACRLGYALEIFGADIAETAPALVFCDEVRLVPRISDAAYIPTLLEICEQERIDALIPTIDTDLLLLAENRSAFDRIGTWVLVGDREKLKLCRDKRLTSDYFHSLGLSAPPVVDDVLAYHSAFPAFMKPRDGSSSVNAYKLANEADMMARAKQVPDYIVQPFVEGTEYTVDVFCDLQGAPIYITPRIRLAVRSGEVLKTQIDQDAQIISEVKRLVADFRPRGAITVQLIRERGSGTDQFIEINPRFGGGAPLSIKAGADSAEALLRILAGETLTYQAGAARDGEVYSRFDQSVCVCVGNREMGVPVADEIRGVVFDLDDTLYSEKTYVKSGFHAVANLLPEAAHAEEALWELFQAGQPAIDALLRQLGIQDERRRQACLEAYRTHLPSISLYPDAEELLVRLREKGIRTGIITDGRPCGQRAKISSLHLSSLVDEILITDELGGPQFRKPNDLSFRVMQRRLQIPFQQMVYIGDNIQKDFAAPVSLGMSVIYFRNPEGLYYVEKETRYPEAVDYNGLQKLLL